jgi:serine/threonine-protein kinase
MILGTAAYMSPEQARGKPADRRADIWAFGCVFFELLTGRQTFDGETVTDCLSAVISREPDWSRLPLDTPESVRRVLRHCLAKDPRQRLHSIADARIDLDDSAPVARTAIPVPVQPSRARWVIAAGAVLLAAALAAWLLTGPRHAPQQLPISGAIPLQDDVSLDRTFPLLALTPDGRNVIYAAQRGPASGLYVRSLGSEQETLLPNTENARMPFVSPDGEWVGFFADGKLKKIRLSGGPAVILCEAQSPRGAAWSGDMIVFTASPTGPLLGVSASAGVPQTLTRIDPAIESTNRWPAALPGSPAVLFTSTRRGDYSNSRVELLDLKTRQRRVLLEQAACARFAAPDRLLFFRNGVLFSVRLDPSSLRVAGEPSPVAHQLSWDSLSGFGDIAASASGVLAYLQGESKALSLVMVKRDGTETPLDATHRVYIELGMAPDGKRLAVSAGSPNSDIWIYDLSRGTPSRVTFQGNNRMPSWTRDSRRVSYVTSSVAAGLAMAWRPADGSAPQEILVPPSPDVMGQLSWTPDGRTAVGGVTSSATLDDIAVLTLDPKPAITILLHEPYHEANAQISPDGRWMAYEAWPSGHGEIFVQPFPGPGPRTQVSVAGGNRPFWNSNGREIFYRQGDAVMSVSVDATLGNFHTGTPVKLFAGPYSSDFAPAPDGQRFMMVKIDKPQRTSHINLVLNWTAESKP